MVLISYIQYQLLTLVAMIFLHFLMFSVEIRKEFGTENLIPLLIKDVPFTLIYGCCAYELTKNKSKWLSFGTGLLYAVFLWILFLISYIHPSLLGNIWNDDIHTIRYACLICSLFCVAVTSAFGIANHQMIRFNVFRLACVNGDMEALERMMINSQNINFNDLDFFNRNGFMLACEYNQCQAVEFLLQNASQIDLDFNQHNDLGQSGFHVASMNKNREILDLILHHSTEVGIDLSHKDNDGKTGFDLAEELCQSVKLELKPEDTSKCLLIETSNVLRVDVKLISIKHIYQI